jgi:signal transduction histidine kinase
MPHIPALPPSNETVRLTALRRYGVLDTAIEQGFEDLTQLAAFICGTPISTVTFIDEHRQWFKSHHGLDDHETPRDQAFCAHAILQRDLFIVPDATLDARFSGNPLVTSNPNIRFYAGAPLVTPDGFGLGTLCVIDRVPRSLTEDQQEALRALSRRTMAQLELRKALGDLYVAYRQLESLERAKGDFVTMVSRDLQPPLKSIGDRLASVIAGGAELTAEHRQSIDEALSATRRLQDLSSDVLDVSGGETGTLRLTLGVCDVAELLESAQDALALSPPGHRRVDAQTADAAGMIAADADRIVEALVSLLRFALLHSPPSAPVTIAADAAQAGVRIIVHADGPGLAPNDLAHLFQPFARATTSGASGDGLSLAIAKAIVEQHRGTVTVDDEVGAGITFVVTLPRK